MTYAYKTMKSPVGELKLVASDKGLAAILWEKDNPRRVRLIASLRRQKSSRASRSGTPVERLFFGKAKIVFVETRFQGNRISEEGLGGAADDSVRGDPELRANCETDQEPKSGARRGRGYRQKSHFHYRSLPSRDRFYWQIDRICRRARGESAVAGIGREKRDSIGARQRAGPRGRSPRIRRKCLHGGSDSRKWLLV